MGVLRISQVLLMDLVEQRPGKGGGISGAADVDGCRYQRRAPGVGTFGGITSVLPVVQQLRACGQVLGDTVGTGMADSLGDAGIPVPGLGPLEFLAGEHAVNPLVNTVQRRAGPLGQVPELVVQAAIDSAGPADADSLAFTAYVQGRYTLAECTWRKAYQAKANDPDIGPDHLDTLASRSNLALVLGDLGRLDEAQAENRAVLETMTRVLGPDHPDTLASRSNLALVLGDLGRLDEAQAENRAVLETRTRVLGPDHPDTLASRSSLARVRRGLGQL